MASANAWIRAAVVGGICALASGCVPSLADNPPREPNRTVPKTFGPSDAAAEVSGQPSKPPENVGKRSWKDFFSSPELQALIETALKNNQELNVKLQEIVIAKNEAYGRRGEYYPKVNAGGGAGSHHHGGGGGNAELFLDRLVQIAELEEGHPLDDLDRFFNLRGHCSSSSCVRCFVRGYGLSRALLFELLRPRIDESGEVADGRLHESGEVVEGALQLADHVSDHLFLRRQRRRGRRYFRPGG